MSDFFCRLLKIHQCSRSAHPNLVKLEAHHSTVSLPIRRLFGPYCLCVVPTRPTGSAAYVINRSAAGAFLERLLPMVVPYDHAFDRGWALGLRVRAITPWPVKTDGPSTISGEFRKLKAWQKGYSLAWRARTETMRFAGALHAWVLPGRRFQWLPRAPAGGKALFDQADREIERQCAAPVGGP